ncbi:MFS transporter [Salirhabdus salicampi]|uniref:MFS transporter n=1 Tax=Salirhabdus salicampi TaxID=476102 RepID=UPI0020C496F5|nr:MFS transporter [Salirhabdus salicampi]MCP8616874.1 MFS transporter [Salirhabdus salicampi]
MKKGLRAIVGDFDINRDLVLLLSIGGLYSLGIFLSNTFVNIFLWKQAGDYVAIALYNLAIYILQPITFILAGRWAKKVDRVIVLRLGVIFLSLFFMTVLFAGEKAATYNILLGAILGIGYGFYWLAFNVLTFEITEPDTRDFFNGFFGLLQSLGGMIGPITAGYIISRMESYTGYTTIFSISLSLFIVAVVCSFFLNRRSAEGIYSPLLIIKERKRNYNWNQILKAHFSQGFREGTVFFVVAIWVFLITNSELALGTFNLVFSACSFLFYYLATRLVKPALRKKAIFFGGTILFASIFLIVFIHNYTVLLIYAAIIGIAYPIIYVPYFSLSFDVIGSSWKAKEMRIEYIVVRELFLNSGRIVSILFFLTAVTMFPGNSVIPYILLIVASGHFFIYFFIRNIHIGKKDEKDTEALVNKEVVEEENR